MEHDEYSAILAQAKDRLVSSGAAVEITGSGGGRFIVADKGDRGLEFYAEEGVFTVDPAVGKELQGERSFQSFEAALEFAITWLDDSAEA